LQFLLWILLKGIKFRVSFCVSFCLVLLANLEVKMSDKMALKAASVLDRCLEILCVIFVSKKERESAKKRE
jgi:hypothetical protein